jgi:hypothetical protein
MCATERAMESGICTNPVHARIIADLGWRKPPVTAPPSTDYSPNWCRKTCFEVHYFGAEISRAPK